MTRNRKSPFVSGASAFSCQKRTRADSDAKATDEAETSTQPWTANNCTGESLTAVCIRHVVLRVPCC